MKSTVYVFVVMKMFLKHIKNTSALMHIISNSVHVLVFSSLVHFFFRRIIYGFCLERTQIYEMKTGVKCVFGRVQFKNITTIHTQMHARSRQIYVYLLLNKQAKE